MSETEPKKHAGLGRRFAALVIDFVALSLIFFPVTRAVKGVWIMSATDHQWAVGWFITDPICITFLIVILMYFVLMEGYLGGTIGKMIVKIRVVGPEYGPPGLRRALIRNLLRAIDALPAFNVLGVILILRSPEGARIGDRVAGTRVTTRI